MGFNTVGKAMPDQYLIRIGRLAVDWAQIEYFSRWFLQILTHTTPAIGAIAFAHMPIAGVIQALAAINSEMEKRKLYMIQEEELLPKVLVQLESVRKSRNDIVHAAWVHPIAIFDGTQMFLKTTARKELVQKHVPVSIEQLDNVLAQMEEILGDLFSMIALRLNNPGHRPSP